MQVIQIKVVNNSTNVKQYLNRVAEKLAVKKRQIAVESQQLNSVGMMPNPQYRVVEPATLSVAEAVRLIKHVKRDVTDGTKYIVVKPTNESVQNRMDREELVSTIRDVGGEIIDDEEFLVHDIVKRTADDVNISLPTTYNQS